MVSEDGNHIVFVVQHIYSKKEGWRNSGLATGFISNVPSSERHTYNIDGKYTGPTQIFNEFSMNGEVGKQHGFCGSFDKAPAEKFMRIIAKHNPDFVFRVAKITIVLVTEQVAMVNYC